MKLCSTELISFYEDPIYGQMQKKLLEKHQAEKGQFYPGIHTTVISLAFISSLSYLSSTPVLDVGALEAQCEMYEKKLADLQTQLQENTSATNTRGSVTPHKQEQSYVAPVSHSPGHGK